MLQNLKDILHRVVPGRKMSRIPGKLSAHPEPFLKAFGLNDFLNIDVPSREMLLSPILLERSLACFMHLGAWGKVGSLSPSD
jgi:hypothetical protein